MSIKELQEKRAAALKVIEDLRKRMDDEKRDLVTDDERKAWDTASAEFDQYQAQIERQQDLDRRTAIAMQSIEPPAIGRENTGGQRQTPEGDSAITNEDRTNAFNAWCRAQVLGDASPEERAAATKVGINLSARTLPINLARRAPRNEAEARALAIGADATGGYTVPEGFVPNLESALLQFGGIRNAAEIMRTESGNDMPWPTANDTSNAGAMINEAGESLTDADPSFGVVTFKAFKGTSKIVLVSREMLEDSAFNMAQWLPEKLGERLGRLMNAQGTIGAGTTAPNGIVTAATLGVTTTSGTAITFDELIDLQHSVDPAYRDMPDAAFMFHDNVLKSLRKIKDSQNRYIWQAANVQTGAGPTLLDKPYLVNQSMTSSIATAQKTVLFGALRKFKFREVRGIHVKYLMERYAEFDQYGFVALVRFDSNLMDAGTRPVKYIQMGAGS